MVLGGSGSGLSVVDVALVRVDAAAVVVVTLVVVGQTSPTDAGPGAGGMLIAAGWPVKLPVRPPAPTTLTLTGDDTGNDEFDGSDVVDVDVVVVVLVVGFAVASLPAA